MPVALRATLLWLASFLQDDKGDTSIKKLVYWASAFTFLGIAIGLSVPVSRDKVLAKEVLVVLIVTLSSMAMGGYLGGKTIEKKKEPADGQGGS